MPRLPFLASTSADDLILGKVVGRFFGPGKCLRVSPKIRRFHCFIAGKTGRGKSKLLQHCIMADAWRGNGLAVLDPHGDLVRETVAALYEGGYFRDPDRARRLIYINPADAVDSFGHIAPFNVYHLPPDPPPGLIFRRGQAVVSTLRRAWKDTIGRGSAPVFEDVMLHVSRLMIQTGSTLMDVPTVFQRDGAYREKLLSQVKDPLLAEFFERFDELGRSGAERKESTLNKITPLRLNPYIGTAFGQKENRMTFREWMDGRYVVLFDLGACDEDTEELYGNFITKGFEDAAYTRIDIPKSRRHPFYLYVDEFQNFSATSSEALSKVLSGTRKFGLHLTLSSQSLDQVARGGLLSAVFGNVSTLVFFGISPGEAQHLASTFGIFALDTGAVKHDAQTDTQHPVYEPIMEQEKKLARDIAMQGQRQATVIDYQGRFTRIETLNVPDLDALTFTETNQIIPPYGIPYEQAMAQLERRYREDPPFANDDYLNLF